MRLFEGNTAIIPCVEWRTQTCRLCGMPPHRGRTCEQVKAMDKDRIVEEKTSEAVVRTRLRCHAQFMKKEGCNTIECLRCKT
jgi:hypothetical protein